MPRKLALRRLIAAVTGAACCLAPIAPHTSADDTPSSTAVHVVQPGETLSDIADRLGIDTAGLARLNAIEDVNLLFAGQVLTLPAGVAWPPAARVVTPSSSASASSTPVVQPSGSGTYLLVEGDTLSAIAEQFGTTAAALVEANHLEDPDRLIAGTRLSVPGASSADASGVPARAPVAARGAPAASTGSAKRSLMVTYTVQPGETLSQIARQFDIPADTISKASVLEDPNRIAVGSILKVPLPGREHVVKQGETLRDIALHERVDLGALIDFNELDDPELIRVDQVVLVPASAQPKNASAQGSEARPAAATPQPRANQAAEATTSMMAVVAAPPPASAKPAAPGARSTQAQAPTKPTPTPTPPVVAPPPRGAPSDGLAGAGVKLLGAPYVFGGSSPSGFDCSGFVWYVARQVGKPLSRSLFGAYNSGSHPSRDELKPGDLVFFQNTYSPGLSHNGIYLGNGQFVHAVDEAAGVTISNVNSGYWSSRWFGATRLP